ncbi:hypothetical protein AMATHDRAFT_4013 [Amanita thiersii Skay4041]|uniref:DNA-directed RNA polymerase n=1 Tax=Amanita thiersii Skay4041 TaxID=703135 RepID=A0A2A9NPX3_9AGAR|nr:hypothetical protein AMATHDRAFT_4013 [Amanita thiersii Skay4041]
MIPRAAARLEATLLYSRQSLPRPARLYSTPTSRANAPALATAQAPRQDYLPMNGSRGPGTGTISAELEAFLHRRQSYTILPPPLPIDRSSHANDLLYGNSPTQDLFGVMDACLHDLYDVPRAKGIFDRLRHSDNNPILEPRVYNAFLEAYINMATIRELESKDYWVEAAWDLYHDMESGQGNATPTVGTYALMLLAWLRFNPESNNPIKYVKQGTPSTLLSSIVKRQFNIQNVIVDRAIDSPEEAAAIVKALSRAAVDLNLARIVSELGQAEIIATNSPDILESVPDVRPVLKAKKKAEDDAESEYEIPFNLDNLRRHLAEVNLARRVLPEDVSARQKLLEESVYDVAVERMKHQADLFAELGLGDNALLQADLQRWMWEWHTKLKARLGDVIRNIMEIENTKRMHAVNLLAPYLLLVNAERLSLITILEIMRLQGSGGVYDGMKTTRALIAVGKAVEIEYKAQMCRKSKIQIPISPRFGDTGYFSKMGYRCLQERRVAAAMHVTDGEAWTSDWTQAVRSKIGGILVECLMDVATVTRTAVSKKTGQRISEEQPAFFHAYEYHRGQKLGVIRLNQVVSERLAREGVRDAIHPRHLPMLIRPKPWVGPDEGGYLYNKTAAMRFKDSSEQLSYLKHASEAGNVELVYAGLDVLGSTPWRINRKVFDVVLQVWNSGERMGKLPPIQFDQPEPEPPENYETDLKARSVYIQRMKGYNQRKANNHSDRCSVNYKIEIARAFLGDTFYLPHNLDFRGRAYPIPPHLNHIGDDLSRGLLTFAEAKPLGERGLRWLKIHLANLYGFDKANFDERVEFVEKHMEEIYDSALRPLDGNRWWSKADDPWQCLAACFELHAALESEDPHAYLSSIPVHQDGTCNGLQHYAALGGDQEGAKQVNLSTADRPSDVYSYVGNMVEKMIAEDVEKGDKYAIMLQGKISRKVVKQTVMTTVYGVTFVGAREQIEKQLKDRKEFPEEDCWHLASYLAKKVLLSIGDLFSGAKNIQNWLNLCARLIAKSIPNERLPEAMAEYVKSREGKNGRFTALPVTRLKKELMTSVVWTTPLGLPIVQPYRKTMRKQIMTAVQTVYISDPNCPAEVNSMKQASAFPPNFIHSLDATHMMLTALECQSQELTFASVHDSYWTHACSTDQMSKIIRETFIALHSSDVLKRLRDEFIERYKGYKIPLMQLRQGRILKQLQESGSQIVATPEQAKSLAAISPLVVISETAESSIDERKASPDIQDIIAMINSKADAIEAEAKTETKAKKSRKRKAKEEEIEEVEEAEEVVAAEEESEFDDDDEDFESPRTKAARKRKEKDEMIAAELYGKFVNLSDILPPLPEKGDFEVETIKKSLYFFS